MTLRTWVEDAIADAEDAVRRYQGKGRGRNELRVHFAGKALALRAVLAQMDRELQAEEDAILARFGGDASWRA